MKIDINKYRCNLSWIENLFEKEKQKYDFDYMKTSTELAAVSHIPLIAILCFYGEIYGFNKDLIDKIESIIKFYGYTEIIGKK